MKKSSLISLSLIVIVFLFGSFIVFSPKNNKNTESKIVNNPEVQGAVDQKTVASNLPTEAVLPTTDQTITAIVGSPTPKPTEKPPQVQSLPPVNPEINTSNAGVVTTLTYKSLIGNVIYHVDLSAYSATSIVIKWPRSVASPQWRYSTDGKVGSFSAFPIDDDGGEHDTVYFSGILTIPQGKVFDILSSKDIPELSILLVVPSESSQSQISTAGVYNSDSGAAYTSLPLITRDSWGANPASWDGNSGANIDDPARYIWYPVYYTVARIVIHHTATAPNYSNPAAAVRAIYLYHAYVRKWGDIGYNFIIDQNGTVYEGKGGGDESQGYHAFGAANRISLGISVIGDYSNTAPSAAVRSALVKLLAEKANYYGFSLKYSDGGEAKWKDIGYTVFGHRDAYRWYDTSSGGYWGTEATACPGNAFKAQLPAIVRDAENYRKANFAQIRSVVSQVNTAFSFPHEQGTLIVKYNVPESTSEETIRSYIPAFSGITDYTISGNTVTFHFSSSIITHPYYGDSEYLIPPMGWSGYSNEYATFTPAFVINGPENRAKTLMKFFKLDSRVATVDLNHTLQIELPH